MINNKKIIAVVTARAGSVGVKGKNYKDFCGLPLVCWSVLAAQRSKYIDSIIVSTNCKEVEKAVLRNSLNNNTVILDRPDILATPTSKNESSLIHAYWWSALQNDLTVDIIINLQPTSPIRDAGLVDKCIESMVYGKYDSLLTVSRDTPLIWRRKDSKPIADYDILNRPMRQDIKEDQWLLHDNGCLYAMNSDILLDRFCRTGINPYLFETTQYQSMQIDTEEDFIIMESVCKSVLNSVPI